MASLRSRAVWIMGGVLAVAIAGIVAFQPSPPAKLPRPQDDIASAGSAGAEKDRRGSFPSELPAPTGHADDAAAPASPQHGVVGRVAWGTGRGEIGRPPDKEGVGETPLRLAPESDGNLLLLDATNGPLVRVGADGRPGVDIRLPVKDPRDVAAAKDGTILVLDATENAGSVALLGPNGKARGTLPLPAGASQSARSVVVVGKDVYLESSKGELTRVGDTDGKVDTAPAAAPGRPTRDGRGFLTALLTEDSGRVHVYVVERGSLRQRFSRLLQASIPVEGIFLIDTDVAGTIYLGVTGTVPGGADGSDVAQLLCLDAERGEVIGKVDLPIVLGPEAIVDAKALDSGGVVYSVSTSQGLRVERHACP